MKEKTSGSKAASQIIFSDSFGQINSPRFTGWIVHMICLAGSGSFLYNSRRASLRPNDAVVISHPESVTALEADADLRVEYVAVGSRFIYNLLPANHYGVGGGITLFDDPVIPLAEDDARRFVDDIRRIRERMADCHHLFYDEMTGSLLLTMIYDLFDFHAKLHDGISASERTTNIVRRLLSMLDAGRCKHHREVSYYAGQLNVSPKYLSQTVKRATGCSVSQLIDRRTVPIIAEYLNNSEMSLTQICEEMNFSSLSYFSRYVHKHLGMSPSLYRAVNSPIRRRG